MFRRRPLIPISIVVAAAVSLLAAGCGGGGGSPTTAASTTRSAALAYAHCMQSHGVPSFPDPDGSGEISKQQIIALGLPSTPQFASASLACERFGPSPGGGQDAAHSPAQIAAFLAFVRCLRGHGLRNFPDPTSTGRLTHQMVADAGINLQQPAVLQAGDACVGASHGVITEADVARFVAGQ